jgi:hypothetical protein
MNANGILRASDALDGVVALVARSVLESAPDGVALRAREFDLCVRDAVTDLWESPIKSFVPLLAARRVRCCLRAGTCACGEC